MHKPASGKKDTENNLWKELEKSIPQKNMTMKNKPKTIKIRAHHLFCMLGFQGYGYSSTFVTNLRTVITAIKNSPSLQLELVSECDTICMHCPNKRHCDFLESSEAMKIKKMDMLVLKKLGLQEKTTLEAEEIFGAVKKKLKNSKDIEEVCGNCKWRQKCLWYLQKDRPVKPEISRKT